MDHINPVEKLMELMKKYRYGILVLAIGLGLMLLPEINWDMGTETEETRPREDSEGTDSRLAQILSRIEGVGRVEVMLTVSAGEETVYVRDTQTGSDSVRVETVIVTDSDRNQSGLIQQVNPPRYLGAIIVCEGADSAAVRYAIVEAVSSITGLGADKISVFKMQ